MKVNDIITEGPLGYMAGIGSHVAKQAGNALVKKGAEVMAPIKRLHNIGKMSSLQSDITNTIKQLGAIISKETTPSPRVDPTFEGFMDYLKGVGGVVADTANKMHRAGVERSQTADAQKLVNLKQKLVNKLKTYSTNLGPNGLSIVMAQVGKMYGNFNPITKTIKQLLTAPSS